MFSEFQQFTPTVSCPGVLAAKLLIQTKPVETQVEAGAQIQQLINVECIDDFVGKFDCPNLRAFLAWVDSWWSFINTFRCPQVTLSSRSPSHTEALSTASTWSFRSPSTNSSKPQRWTRRAFSDGGKTSAGVLNFHLPSSIFFLLPFQHRAVNVIMFNFKLLSFFGHFLVHVFFPFSL